MLPRERRGGGGRPRDGRWRPMATTADRVPASIAAAGLGSRVRAGDPEVGIVGLGYVGLPLATTFASAGVPVLGLDAVRARVDGVNAGVSHVEDVASEDLRPLTDTGWVRATTEWEAMRA